MHIHMHMNVREQFSKSSTLTCFVSMCSIFFLSNNHSVDRDRERGNIITTNEREYARVFFREKYDKQTEEKKNKGERFAQKTRFYQ